MTLQAIRAPSGFAQYIEWTENPDAGVLTPLWFYLPPTNVYAYDGGFAVTLSLATDCWLSLCTDGLFDRDLAENASVVLGDNLGMNLPIHITFSKPVSRVGAYVSADAVAGQPYLRQLGVKLTGSSAWEMVTAVGPISSQRGSATFLGAQDDGGRRIREVWFDVVNLPGNAFDILQVAIGNLYYSR